MLMWCYTDKVLFKMDTSVSIRQKCRIVLNLDYVWGTMQLPKPATTNMMQIYAIKYYSQE